MIANPADGGVLYWAGKLYGFGAILFVIATSIACVYAYAYFRAETPALPDLASYARAVPAVSRIYTADGTVLGEFAEEWREVVPYERIPPKLVNAFLAAEDHEFFQHSGIYFRGIARAAWRNVVEGDFAQGGSTISQQVAKQFLGSEKSLSRKAKEAIMARRLEATYSKKAILSVYMNHIFLGNGAYGVKAAALRYFDKPLDELDLSEAAMIAGLAQAPSRFSPTRSPERAKARRDEVLDRMERYGFAPANDVAAAKAKPLVVHTYRDMFGEYHPYFAEHIRRTIADKYGKEKLRAGGLTIEGTLEPVADAYAYDTVQFGARRQDKRQGWRGPEAYLDSDKARGIFLGRAQKRYGAGPLESRRHYLGLVTEVQARGAKVQVGATVYDLPIKNMKWAAKWSKDNFVNDRTIGNATQALKVGDVIWVSKDEPITHGHDSWKLDGHNPRWESVPSEDRLARMREEAEGRVVLEQVPHPQSSILTADHETGYIVAMVGGTDYTRSVYNRTVQACRQPGSTYKPIYYSAALDIGFGYDTVLHDVPKKEVDPITGAVWIPTNFDGSVDSRVSLEYALVYSKNIPSVSIFSKVGANEVEKWARRLGFTTKIIPDKALALGASCTMLDELTRAFAIFARNGRWIEFTPIRRIFDRNGELVEDNTVYYDPLLPPGDRVDRLAKTAGIRPKQAIPARTGWLTSKLLANVIENGFASIVRNAGMTAAGKTGTSSATMDTSFVAYTSRWITSVWLGDDMRERPLGRDDAAYMTVVPMWARYMAAATEGHPNLPIPWWRPDGVDPNDRGDHAQGGRMRMPLYYRRGPKPPWELDSPDG